MLRAYISRVPFSLSLANHSSRFMIEEKDIRMLVFVAKKSALFSFRFEFAIASKANASTALAMHTKAGVIHRVVRFLLANRHSRASSATNADCFSILCVFINARRML